MASIHDLEQHILALRKNLAEAEADYARATRMAADATIQRCIAGHQYVAQSHEFACPYCENAAWEARHTAISALLGALVRRAGLDGTDWAQDSIAGTVEMFVKALHRHEDPFGLRAECESLRATIAELLAIVGAKDVFEGHYNELCNMLDVFDCGPQQHAQVKDALERALFNAHNWEETAAQMCRDMQYYRRLVERCGEALGDAAYVADDGSVSQDILCAKVPELVKQLVRDNDALQAAFAKPSIGARNAELNAQVNLLREQLATIAIGGNSLASVLIAFPVMPAEDTDPKAAYEMLEEASKHAPKHHYSVVDAYELWLCWRAMRMALRKAGMLE